MSRGPGKIDRVIAALFAAEPDNAFMLYELLCAVYPDVDYYEKKHRVAVLRAAKRRPNTATLHSDAQGRMLVFYTPDNVLSRAMAYLKADFSYALYTQWGKRPTDDELRAKLRKGGEEYRRIATAQRHVTMFKAERSGDHKTLARLKAYEERGFRRSVQKAKGLIAGISKGKGRTSEP
jgi:hypothetical protein